MSPGGKLPISFPRATGQLPVYYDRKPTSFRSYLDLTREPLFPLLWETISDLTSEFRPTY